MLPRFYGAAFILALTTVALGVDTEAQDESPAAHRKFEIEQAHFRCELPADWALTRDARDDAQTRSFGVYAFYPRATPPRPAISVRYYSREHQVFRSAEHYLKRQLEGGVSGLPDEETPDPKQTKLGGLEAKIFTRDTFDYYPPRSMDTKKIPVRKECLVAQSKEGFFVLRYESPISSFDRWRPAFQHVIDTFELVP